MVEITIFMEEDSMKNPRTSNSFGGKSKQSSNSSLLKVATNYSSRTYLSPYLTVNVIVIVK